MLARLRPLYSTGFRQCAQRALATEVEAASARREQSVEHPLTDSPPAATQSKAESSPASQVKRVFTDGSAGILVRPWDGIRSMPELFAIIRGIERKYGKIREYRLGRDLELRSKYVPWFRARFHDPAASQRLEKGITLIQVEVPIIDETRPGGIGLDDLQDLLESYDWQGPGQDLSSMSVIARPTGERQGEDGERKTRIVDLRIEHSAFRSNPSAPMPRRTTPYFMNSFHEWGGFFKRTPETPPEVTQWMDQARAKWNRTQPPKTEVTGPDALAELAQRGEESSSRAVEERDFSVPADDRPVHAAFELGPTELASTQPAAQQPAATLASSSAHTVASAAAAGSPATEESTSPAAEVPPAPAPKRLGRRERILAMAYENARMPLPTLVQMTEQARQLDEQKKKEREQREEEEERVRLSLRERLWKLMGQRWF